MTDSLDRADDRYTADGVAFSATGVTRRFGSVTALSDVHLRVAEGAFLLLVGANGAGKTTLLSLFLDFLAPTAGALRVFGIDPTRDGGRVRATIGYVPEGGTWPWTDLTLAEYIAYQSRFRLTWDAPYATHLAQALDLKLTRRIRDASKGEFRRAQLLTALAHRPPALVMDEPTDGLDPLMREGLKDLLAEHLSGGPCTVIVSSHLVHELEGFADTLAVMQQGRLTDSVARDELRRDMRRIRLRPPHAGWTPPTLPRTRRLRREERGGEELWTVWGPHAEVVDTFRAAGAEVSDVGVLSLEDAAVALLRTAADPAPAAGSDLITAGH